MDNRVLKQVPANSTDVVPFYIKQMESKGLVYATKHFRGEATGAQCGHCHTIVWVLGRKDPILNEKKPDHIPDYGPMYEAYYPQKLERFLRSLPPCPECHTQSYDLFISNLTLVRFKDGQLEPGDGKINEELSESAKDTLIWVYD